MHLSGPKQLSIRSKARVLVHSSTTNLVRSCGWVPLELSNLGQVSVLRVQIRDGF